MRNKIFKLICLPVVLAATGYSLSFADDNISSKKEITQIKKEHSKITKPAEAADKKINPLKAENDKLKAERASVYEELGTAYTKAGMFDEAMDAYTKSLSYGPNNARIHYYLGLLYQKNRHDPEKAAFHLKRYLYLNPDAKDKKEVLYLIEMVLNKR